MAAYRHIGRDEAYPQEIEAEREFYRLHSQSKFMVLPEWTRKIREGDVIVLTEDRRLFKATLCRPGLATIERIGATVMDALDKISIALSEEATGE